MITITLNLEMAIMITITLDRVIGLWTIHPRFHLPSL